MEVRNRFKGLDLIDRVPDELWNVKWPKDWSFSFSISPSNEYSGSISYRIDWFDLLAGPRTLKSLLQHHSLKASVLWCSVFFKDQLSHPYMTTRKTMVFIRKIFVGKVMSLLFNTLSRMVLAFLPRSKPQTQQFKQDETEEYPADKGTG